MVWRIREEEEEGEGEGYLLNGLVRNHHHHHLTLFLDPCKCQSFHLYCFLWLDLSFVPLFSLIEQLWMNGNHKVGNFMGYEGLRSVLKFRSREWLTFGTLHESWMCFLQILTQMRARNLLDIYFLKASTF